jgi:SpoVK/Ycf46/Vps4 family AAA+-type ATPase
MKQTINYKIRAAFPLLNIVSYEEQRVAAEVRAVAADLKYTFLNWSLSTGLTKYPLRAEGATKDPPPEDFEAPDYLSVLDHFLMVEPDDDGRPHGTTVPDQSIVLLRDFHLHLAEPEPLLIRKLKDCIISGKNTNRHLVIVGCKLRLPPELEKEVAVIEFALPDREELNRVLEALAREARLEVNGVRDAILDAASGLTTTEAENVMAEACIRTGGFNDGFARVVQDEKAATIKKGGILEIINTNLGIDDVGGLAEMKEWMVRRAAAFSKDARDYGLPLPKGVLQVGIWGCGKSLFAKAAATILRAPLVKVDFGAVFAGIVGSSEANMRNVIQTAEAIAPCVLWVDEVEKGLPCSKNSGQTDGGTSARVFGTFLQWMQEKKKAVFIIATANDISQLPPEFLRKGRFDELFFVDLPNANEREEIWRIQIRKAGRNPEKFELSSLSKLTDGWSGAEIEALLNEGLYAAFEDGRKEPDNLTLATLAANVIPLSKTMSVQLEALREWANGRARRATALKRTTSRTERKLGLN